MHIYNYLALGDSYTIGEAVLLQQSFPYQVVQLLRRSGHNFQAPEIIAKTGWTTDELAAAMTGYRFLPKYDFVTLLVGVNNQYRGRDLIEYKEQFEDLLNKALQLAGGNREHLLVISIPDYGVTPFAKDSDREKIAKEVDFFNGVSRALSAQYKTAFIDITPGSREAATTPELVASDGLHPSAAAYAVWAEKLAEHIAAQLK